MDVASWCHKGMDWDFDWDSAHTKLHVHYHLVVYCIILANAPLSLLSFSQNNSYNVTPNGYYNIVALVQCIKD